MVENLELDSQDLSLQSLSTPAGWPGVTPELSVSVYGQISPGACTLGIGARFTVEIAGVWSV